MILDIILGVNMDTPMWIADLRSNCAEDIIVVDYDYYGDPEVRDGVTYMNPMDAHEYMKEFDSLNFYKSMYGYPGMDGRMSSLFKKNAKIKKDEHEDFTL